MEKFLLLAPLHLDGYENNFPSHNRSFLRREIKAMVKALRHVHSWADVTSQLDPKKLNEICSDEDFFLCSSIVLITSIRFLWKPISHMKPKVSRGNSRCDIKVSHQQHVSASCGASPEKYEILWAQFDKNWCHYRFESREICWSFVWKMSQSVSAWWYVLVIYYHISFIKWSTQWSDPNLRRRRNENGEKGTIAHLELDLWALCIIFLRELMKGLTARIKWVARWLGRFWSTLVLRIYY